jgi:hypothetical protein
MATDLTPAVDALVKSVERLADAVKGQADSGHWALGVNLAVAAATIAIAGFTFLAARKAAQSANAARDLVEIERLREGRQSEERERQREEERSQVAGALAAELRGLATRWQEIAPALKAIPGPVVWFADENYLPVYDGMGPKLLLLPPALAEDVVAYYTRAKGSIDSLRAAGRLTEYSVLSPSESVRGQAAAGALQQKTFACEECDRLMACVEAGLLPRLDAIAKGEPEPEAAGGGGSCPAPHLAGLPRPLSCAPAEIPVRPAVVLRIGPSRGDPQQGRPADGTQDPSNSQ